MVSAWWYTTCSGKNHFYLYKPQRDGLFYTVYERETTPDQDQAATTGPKVSGSENIYPRYYWFCPWSCNRVRGWRDNKTKDSNISRRGLLCRSIDRGKRSNIAVNHTIRLWRSPPRVYRGELLKPDLGQLRPLSGFFIFWGLNEQTDIETTEICWGLLRERNRGRSYCRLQTACYPGPPRLIPLNPPESSMQHVSKCSQTGGSTFRWGLYWSDREVLWRGICLLLSEPACSHRCAVKCGRLPCRAGP